MIESTTRNDVS